MDRQRPPKKSYASRLQLLKNRSRTRADRCAKTRRCTDTYRNDI